MEKEKIKIRKRVCNLKKTIKLNGDFLVPDTKPDIISVIGSNGICLIRKDDVLDGKVRLDGDFNGYIIYLSDLGETKGLNINFEFLEEFEDDNIKNNDDEEWTYKILDKNIKILNERKINIQLTIELSIEVFNIENIEFISNFDNKENVQKLEKNITIKEYLNDGFTKNNINEELNIEETNNVEIIKKSLNIENIEKKISYNKILVKADAVVKLLFIQNNQIKSYVQKIPLMSFIELQNVSEDNIIDLNYMLKKYSVDNLFNCDIEYELKCNVYKQKEINIIEDLYCLEKNLDYTKMNIILECTNDVDRKEYEFSEKINISNIKEIYDYNYVLKQIDNIDGKNYEGIANISLYFCKDDNSGLIEKSIDIPFIINSVSSNDEFYLNECIIKSVSDEWVCEFKIGNNLKNNYKNISIINNYEISEINNNDNYSMIIYYVKNNDTLWNIAKKFRVSMEKIISLNNLSNPDMIIPGDKIYIMRG